MSPKIHAHNRASTQEETYILSDQLCNDSSNCEQHLEQTSKPISPLHQPPTIMGPGKPSEVHRVLPANGPALLSKRATYDPRMISPLHSSSGQVSISSSDYNVHPSIAAYQLAHPRRGLINFGPYVLLQTLGEGEFGKVKLGVHKDYGEEVAVKLIRRGSVESSTRLTKVEREIDVLKAVKHPNIVRLFDVIETEKYIGIILDFANGGELFDHILAHRYLKEKDAAKLFAQLISGVHYLHQKKIVHRDLKLENLLLDKHRNVIITDFGFANRFEHKPDDLMATSCGSPCYAAPELVISEGLYVGSAVDIWSCGVILYAMLSGYLPFDDDPANPDGDNINLLYRYIVNTPLTFPDYLSMEARDLLSRMLVPDPLSRCDLESIMGHPWLRDYRSLFQRSVHDLEAIAQEQQNHKRASSRKAMQIRLQQQEQSRIGHLARQATEVTSDTSLILADHLAKLSRHQSIAAPVALLDMYGVAGRHDALTESQSHFGLQRGSAAQAEDRDSDKGVQSLIAATSARGMKQINRHTIQVEYPTELPRQQEPTGALEAVGGNESKAAPEAHAVMPADDRLPQESHSRIEADKIHQTEGDEAKKVTGSVEDSSSEAMSSQNTRGQTLLAGPLDPPDMVSSKVVSKDSVKRPYVTGSTDYLSRSPTHPELGARRDDKSTSAVGHQVLRPMVAGQTLTSTTVKDESAKQVDLTLSSDPISSRVTTEGIMRTPMSQRPYSEKNALTSFKSTENTPRRGSSSSAARKVMDWFRRKGTYRGSAQTPASAAKNASTARHEDVLSSPGVLVPSAASLRVEAGRDLPSPSVRDGPPNTNIGLQEGKTYVLPQPSAEALEYNSGGVDASRSIPSQPILQEDALRYHTGIVDQAALTTLPPSTVLVNVLSALLELDIEYKFEGDARLRCTRARKEDAARLPGKARPRTDARAEGSDKRLLQHIATGTPPAEDRGLSSSSSIKTLLSRRSSNQANQSSGPGRLSTPLLDVAQAIVHGSSSMLSPRKGDDGRQVADQGDEIRFSVEITRLRNLPGLLSLDVKRLKGNVWAYKVVHDALIERSKLVDSPLRN